MTGSDNHESDHRAPAMEGPAWRHIPVRPDWLGQVAEAPIAPALPIIDAHHHLWDRPGNRYLAGDLLMDIAESGHNIIGTVYVQAFEAYRRDGPEEMAPVGETEFALACGSEAASEDANLCAGIVGFADLTRGVAARAVLEAHMQAGGGRFRGIRQITAWDPDQTIANPTYGVPSGMLGETAFREGFACLAPLGLSFDAWLYHPQIPDVVDLAQSFPDTTIVLNHAGGPLGINAYADARKAVFAAWRVAMAELAACPNVFVKLGGLAMRLNGLGLHDREQPPTSEEMAAAIAPFVLAAIDLFGVERCLFESNFPVDKGSCSYGVFWNACKRLTAEFSESEQQALFRGTAETVYRLEI